MQINIKIIDTRYYTCSNRYIFERRRKWKKFVKEEFKSNHKESEKIDEVVIELEKNKIKYKTLSDGNVIIEDTKKEN